MSDFGDPSTPVGPVHRAFVLLQLVVAADGPIGVRELARRADVSKSTVARMLGILADLGMVERTIDGAALPGAGLASLTRRVDRSAALLREVLRPLTADIERTFGENAAVGIDAGDGFLYLASARAGAAVQVADPTGVTYPYHLVAPGLVAMAEWPDERLERELAEPLERATERSVVDPNAIRARLDGIRADGFAWTDQELDDVVNGVAVPVRGSDESMVAVATLYGPAYRLSAELCPDLGEDLARLVSARAGSLGLG
jgi:DNA-binding IclR family transcriptional regulator